MTGNELRSMREAYGLTPAQLADLLGVSSVYRWEAHCETRPIIDPFQSRVLTVMRDVPLQFSLGHEIKRSLARNGGLRALYTLLEAVYDR